MMIGIDVGKTEVIVTFVEASTLPLFLDSQ